MKLVKGKKAESPKGMRHNVKVMEKAGYPKKRAMGAAYGEVGMAKKARKDESMGMKKAMAKKGMKHDDAKQDAAMIKKMIHKHVKKSALK